MSCWKKCLGLLVVISLSSVFVGCRKAEEKTPKKQPTEKKVDVRAKRVCERTVKDYLEAAASMDFRKALEFIDLEEMVLQARDKPTALSASSPADAEQLKEMLVSMLEKNSKQAGKLSYKILGSKVSGDRATVEVELYRDGKLSEKEAYHLAKTDDGWKLSGSAIRALLPRMKPPP